MTAIRVGLFIDGRGPLRWQIPGVDHPAPEPAADVLTVFDCCVAYTVEHCKPRGGDPKRAWIAFAAVIDTLGPDFDCAALKRDHGRQIVKHELARGVSSATARKHLTMFLAALNHAKKEERLKVVPKFQMPDASSPRLRWLTRDEHRRLMQLVKPKRRHLFWLLAFGTGARSAAICQLTWDRVDLERRTIDFRVPGAVYRNKRRAVVPIGDALLPRLESAYARRDPADPYVIGAARNGKPSTTYAGCKADLRKIGITERGVARHVARHTVASWILQEGGDVYDVAKLLGDTVGMVEKVYGHVEPSHLLRAANLLH